MGAEKPSGLITIIKWLPALIFVKLRGFEPLTFCLPAGCANALSWAII
jgi:hypothetical protein